MSLPDFQMFANRLKKMSRHFGKWARRQGITCYRVYDADIPEFPLAVDIYERYAHVAEYHRNHNLSGEEYLVWRDRSLEIIAEVLEIHKEAVFYKTREQQKGISQYEKQSQQQREAIVTEDGLKFIVNLSDYLDTGLFLDHRILRKRVREESAGKKVLNLFAYTGSFSVYALAGGAQAATTIDLSRTYLDWAARNVELNHLSREKHHIIRTDIKKWLEEWQAEKYDLVVLDPPTFSNSKSMSGILDIQRDHPQLIEQTLKKTTQGGKIYFSTNHRKFKPAFEGIRQVTIREITSQTVPPDFQNSFIHRCFEIIKQ